MDAKTLRSFLTLAETLHFGRAASACHMSPSTLSRAIAQLETRVGVALFERTNRHVSLTSEGQLLRQYARESLALWESFRDALTEDARTKKRNAAEKRFKYYGLAAVVIGVFFLIALLTTII